MGRMYSSALVGTSVSAIQDVFELSLPAGISGIIHEVEIMQEDLLSTEMLRIKFHRGTATGSGGTTGVKSALGGAGEPAADATVEHNNTTQSVETSVLKTFVWNILTPFHYLPTPETRIFVPVSTFFIVELEVAPSSAANMLGSITWEEIG